MARTIFIYGLMAGVLTLMLLGIGMGMVGVDHGAEGMIWGYGSMIIGLSLIFMGVRRYAAARGALSFGRAFGLALGIAIVASLVYTLGWEAYLAATGYTFANEFASQAITGAIAEGATPAQLAKLQADMADFKTMYANPAYRLGMTFLEIAPVGLLLSLIAAATLRGSGGTVRTLEGDED